MDSDLLSDAEEPANRPETYFAPAGRVDLEKMRDMARQSVEDPILSVVLRTVGGYVLILNEKRQVLAANDELLDALGLSEMDSLVAQRPGEIFGCENASEGPDGCGTSLHCQACGAVLAMLAAGDAHKPVTNECALSMRSAGKLICREFRVRATPLSWRDRDILVLVLHDISAEKRRTSLERVFLHDLRNTMGGLIGWAQLLERDSSEDDMAHQIVRISEVMNRTVDDQYSLLLAENGELPVRIVPVRVAETLDELRLLVERHYAFTDRVLNIVHRDLDAYVRTDSNLLLRVLTNMVKNAFEAVGEHGVVRVWFERLNGRPCFCVFNAGAIPEYVALRLFQRGFSTKNEPGRGLGTYCMRLLGEQYLGGKIDFTSNQESGTTFRFSLPADKKETA
jgi:hypothetical protein